MAQYLTKLVQQRLLPLGLGLLTLGLFSCDSNSASSKDRSALPGFDLRNLDTTVQPCQDFYTYVAGGWQERHPIPPSESRWGSFGILARENYRKLHDLLDSLKARDTGKPMPHYGQLIREHYRAGMDSFQIKRRDLEPLQPYLREIRSIHSPEDHRAYVPYALRLGFDLPFAMRVGVDDKKSDSYILEFSQSGLGLPDRDYYLRSDSSSEAIQRKYRDHIATMLSFLPSEEGHAQEQAERIYRLERKMARAMMDRVTRRNPDNTYHKWSRAKVEHQLSTLGIPLLSRDLGLQWDSALVKQPDYFASLEKLWQEIPSEDWRAYHTWHLLRNSAGLLPYRFQEEHFQFYKKVLRGTAQMKPRWRRVINTLGSGLGEPLGRLYVDRYFSKTAKEEVELMVEDMRAAFRDRIQQLTWMTDSTQQRALKKLDAFQYKIGFPEKWKNYKRLELSSRQFFENQVLIRAFNIRRNFSKLGKPVDKDEWFMPPYLVNAYYSPSFNEIVFPAGILQPPFYDHQGDMALNYGGIGGVIAHEFTHGFDDQGSKYDEKGNLENWWTARDRENFDQRTDRMAKQYSQYKPTEDASVNGELTLGENIADLGGVILAYYGYQKRLERSDQEAQVVAGYTWEQRIFMGWGQVWQTNQTREYTRNQVMTDPHSPARYRVNGPLANMEEFASAWECSVDSSFLRPDSLQVRIW